MKRILIIEDDEALLRTLSTFLELESFEIIPVKDGEKGFRLASEKEMDLILLDYILPSLNGLEICRRLREKGVMTPIIMLTGERKNEIDKVLGLELGADDYITKPFATKELLARIRAVLRRSRPEVAEVEEFSGKTKTFQAPMNGLLRGSILAERYEIVEELGRGGMGRVYKALDRKIDEEVALKMLNPEIPPDKKTLERFKNELKFTRKISQRNVCRMYDFGDEQGTYYITMEYVPGEDLKSLLRRMGRLSTKEALSIAKQLCEGLAEAHRLGVVHRDLKPHNIMIDREGNARIMDFGIARFTMVKGITEEGMMIGTPEYMSPEQVEGKEIDHRSDICSLGVILYEMATGKVPFEGATPLNIALKHKSEKPPDPKEYNTQIPQNLCPVILRCLEKDREKRYQEVKELLFELNQIDICIATAEETE